MNILHINTLDIEGGAARAMQRLHVGLQRLGQHSHVLVGVQAASDPDTAAVGPESAPFRGFADKARDTIGLALETRFGLNGWAYRNSWHIPQFPAFREADVVHLHNLHGGYFNIHALPELARHKPLVWTLHDMWALTGHCAYSYGCEYWQAGCHDCPLLREPGRQIVEPPPTATDRTGAVWRAKRRLYRETPLHIVAPSRWLCGMVQQSILSAAASVQHIPYGVDLEVFQPLDRRAARRALDLPADATVVFASAAGLQNGRKGVAYLLEALEELASGEPIWLLTSGEQAELVRQAHRFNIRQLGYVDEQRQPLAFAAADLFALPTLADNLPLVLIEALACGTPSVAFDVGGVSELVQHLETGYLARPRDAADLAHGMRLLLHDDGLRERMRHRCREVAETEYSLEQQARRYLDVYEEAIQQTYALPSIN
jgi:glycosyltransferase involved in cell wall biosynthesis